MKKVIKFALLILFLIALGIYWALMTDKQTAPGDYEIDKNLNGGELA